MNDNNIFVEVHDCKLREELEDLAPNFIEDDRNCVFLSASDPGWHRFETGQVSYSSSIKTSLRNHFCSLGVIQNVSGRLFMDKNLR